MLIDEPTRSQAIRIDQSFIVQAPAGSGKTSLLVKRFLNLLAICNNPAECLAITFTKKAAFEMRYRVLQALEQQIVEQEQNPKLSEELYIKYKKIIANPNCLKILTIDALCAKLTQQMPILSKLGVNVIINEDPKELYLEAIDRLLGNLHNNLVPLTTKSFRDDSCDLLHNNSNTYNNYNYLVKFLEYLGNNHEIIKNLLINMLAKREQWLPLIVPLTLSFNKKINLKTTLENNLRLAIEDQLADLLCNLPSNSLQNKILYLAKYAANNILDPNNEIINAKGLTTCWPKAKIIDLPLWRAIAALLLNKDGQLRRQVNVNQGFLAAANIKDPEYKKLAVSLKKEMQELLQDLEHEKFFLTKLKQITILPNLFYSEENWEFLQNLFKLLPELTANLMVVFQEKQQVDFAQVAISALEAMGSDQEPTDLGFFMDHRINHILVDEFQDTSTLQFNLLKKLIANWQDKDGRTIFLVGDPMQSIYRFRQAEVGLFLQVQQQGIGQIKLKKLYLETNFRSKVNIVTILNQVFSKIFPQSYDITLGGVCYNKAVANNLDNAGEVQFFLVDNLDQEANSIIDLIQRIKKQDPTQSIAILLRAKVHANHIIKKLRIHGIKFQANDLEQLSNKEIIGDLIALTRAILHVNDLIAWWALLRGPLIGLKLIDLHALCPADLNLNSTPLFEILKNYKTNKQLSKDAIIRLDYIWPILVDAISKRETLNLSKLIKSTWLKLGGNLLVPQEGADLVEVFFHDLLKIKNIFDIEALEKLVEKQFVSLQFSKVDPHSVQLMTIHKAKGLEFDTVIVPSMTKKLAKLNQQLLLWEERITAGTVDLTPSNYLLFAPIKSSKELNNTIYNYIKNSEEQRDLYEAQRLLYVAITRAKNNFYGLGCKSVVGNNSFFKFLEPHVKFESYVGLNDVTATGRENCSNDLDKNSKLLKRIPSKWY